MGADISVRHSAGHPDYAFVGVPAVHHTGSLSYEFHNPHLVPVGNRKALAFGIVPVFICKRDNYLDCLTSACCSFQGYVDKGAIVHNSCGIPEFGTASIGGLGDNQLLFIHIAHSLVGERSFRDASEKFAGIPFHHISECASVVVAPGTEVEFPEELVGVGCVGNQAGPVFAGPLGYENVGAGVGCVRKRRNQSCGCSGDKRCSYIHIFKIFHKKTKICNFFQFALLIFGKEDSNYGLMLKFIIDVERRLSAVRSATKRRPVG